MKKSSKRCSIRKTVVKIASAMRNSRRKEEEYGKKVTKKTFSEYWNEESGFATDSTIRELLGHPVAPYPAGCE